MLPDATVWVSGSIPNSNPAARGAYPFEYRVEIFTPPYLVNNPTRPVINSCKSSLAYGESFTIEITTPGNGVDAIRVVAVNSGFKTHNVDSQQRLVVLKQTNQAQSVGNAITLTVSAPPNGGVAPPGYYMIFVVYDGVPSVASWAQIGGDPAGFASWHPGA